MIEYDLCTRPDPTTEIIKVPEKVDELERQKNPVPKWTKYAPYIAGFSLLVLFIAVQKILKYNSETQQPL